MSSIDDEILLEAEDDARAVAYVKAHLPKETDGVFSDEQILYCLDAIADYYATSGLLDAEPDKDGFVAIDVETVAQYIHDRAVQDGVGDFETGNLELLVELEMDYAETQE